MSFGDIHAGSQRLQLFQPFQRFVVPSFRRSVVHLGGNVLRIGIRRQARADEMAITVRRFHPTN